MEIGIILVIISIIWLIIASINDLKTREVPDWLSYSLIALGASFIIIDSLIKKDVYLFLMSLVGFAVFFIIANVMYYTRQWGGGDAKLLMGLGIIYATYPKELISIFNPNLTVLPFLAVILINIVLVGVIYGLIWSVSLAVKNKDKFYKSFKNIMEKHKKIRYIVVIATLILLSSSFFITYDIRILIIIFAALLFFLFYLSMFIKAVESACMFKKISVDNLTEGDWVVNKIVVDGKLLYSPKGTGIEKEDIINLKKFKNSIGDIIIKEGIPFVPTFLMGIIVSLLFGNIIRIF